ncbi:SDR family oxidoreductase [Nocardioides anomalus]|uniref:SDR family oxidoreductase n=1 Tax=Nocardioides anomalus TaxID=2712223 RepID=A0A6G6WA64_9ACTN|nr:SDR family oxidoreductase [Nocardioides anomalus]QIG42047.1 SDR family oxidoreductase [Nocardioides anomalus]
MKVVVIGGTGLIGSQVVEKLNAHGHEAIAASLQTGVNTLTGEGLTAALEGAEALLDVSNSPSFADEDVMRFFTNATTNLVAAARSAGVRHYVALSVVGCDRLPASGYLRAKVAQERLIAESGLPFTIVRATQFFEFLGAIAESSANDATVHLSPGRFQPIAAADVSTLVAETVVAPPVAGVVELGGPEPFRMSDLVTEALRAAGDIREVVVDEHAEYFGTELVDDSLVPGPEARLGSTTYAAWAAAR